VDTRARYKMQSANCRPMSVSELPAEFHTVMHQAVQWFQSQF